MTKRRKHVRIAPDFYGRQLEQITNPEFVARALAEARRLRIDNCLICHADCSGTVSTARGNAWRKAGGLMSKKWTHTTAFQFYGTEPRNTMWSWSARSEDPKTVVVTLWKDELIGRAGKMVCARSDRGDWHDGPGYRYFMEDLTWARENCDGLVRVRCDASH